MFPGRSNGEVGGVAANVGVPLFRSVDLALWRRADTKVHLADAARMSGFIELKRARVRWFLSVDLTAAQTAKQANKTTFRSITVDGRKLNSRKALPIFARLSINTRWRAVLASKMCVLP